MEPHILLAVLLPFFGTGAGAAFVFFLRKNIRPDIQRILAGNRPPLDGWPFSPPAAESGQASPF